jgi:hypothetical protein
VTTVDASTRGRRARAKGNTLAERLWKRVVAADNGCREWTGHRARDGYGQISSGEGRRLIGTHVAAWIVTNGPVLDGLWVLHKCDNPPCVNPEHLFLGSGQDNSDDMRAKGRARGPRGLVNGHGRLTAEQVAEIRRRWEPGCGRFGPERRSGNTAELAHEFGVTSQYVGQLARGLWRKEA